jgi:hypothetical protein
MRGLYAWAKEAGFVKFDRAAGVKYPTLKSGKGFPTYSRRSFRHCALAQPATWLSSVAQTVSR